jgi:hypothetical protein
MRRAPVLCALVGLLVSGVGGAPGPASIRFADVTQQAAVGIVGDGHGAAVNDYDGDGYLDIYVATKDAANASLLHNRGDGRFENVTQWAGVVVKSGEPHGVAWGDFNKDGRLDLYVGNWRDPAPVPNILFMQNDDGTFRNANIESGLSIVPALNTHGVTLGDFDNDGWLDMFAGAARTVGLLLHNNGDGTFRDDRWRAGMKYSQRSHFMSTLDWDEDGWLDIFVSSFPGGNAENRLYRNRGNGVFEEIGARTPLLRGAFHGGRFADFDNDGHLDLVAPEEVAETPHGYFANRGGRLVEIGSRTGLYLGGPDRVHALAVGDCDNDGRLDIFMVTISGAAMLFRNLGGHRFQQVTGDIGIPAMPNAKAAVFCDYNNDGWLDIFVAVSGAPCRLLRNMRGAGHFLKVKLVGTRSNRDAIGARIYLKAGGRLQMREVCGGNGHQQDPFVQHFGLGKSAKVDSLTVQWPSKARQTLANLSADRTIVIEEP